MYRIASEASCYGIKWQSQRSRLYDIPLQWLMFIPFGLQIIGALGLVSCFPTIIGQLVFVGSC